VDAYLGEIRLFAGDFAPTDWMFCDGSLVSVSTYQALFSLLSTTYGGDGTNTFGLPDLNGRIPIGTGQGQGLSKYVLGQFGGEEQVGLTAANLPPHSHTIQVSSSAATSAVPSFNLTLATVDPSLHLYVDTTKGSVTGTTDFSANALSTDGNGLPHDNIMPYVGLHYIICVNGLYP